MGLVEEKPLSKSKTFWGVLIALVPVIDTGLSLIGVVPAGTLSEGAGILVSAAGSLLAIYGRVKAEKKIG